MSNLSITILFTALSTGMLIYLSLLVIEARRKNQVSLGFGKKDEMERIIRMHGNFVEYTPFALIQCALIEMHDGSAWLLVPLMLVFMASRVSHALGLQRNNMQWRVWGMRGTFGVLVVQAVL
ncbi:MAG: MAPEG family protein, partial [Alphaproteobacteria bacterium]